MIIKPSGASTSPNISHHRPLSLLSTCSPSAWPSHSAPSTADTSVRCSVVIRIAVARIAAIRRVTSATAVVVCADSYSGADQRHGDERGCCLVLVLHHLRTVVCLHAAPVQFLEKVLLERWVLALQERATQCRLIDRFRVGLKRLPGGGASSEHARKNEHTNGAQHTKLHEIPQRFTRLQKSTSAIESRCALETPYRLFLGDKADASADRLAFAGNTGSANAVTPLRSLNAPAAKFRPRLHEHAALL